MCMNVLPEYLYVHAYGGKKRMSHLLELELGTIISHLCVLLTAESSLQRSLPPLTGFFSKRIYKTLG